jgi:AraC family transcriptional regulator, glycine betaine-responsive activator
VPLQLSQFENLWRKVMIEIVDFSMDRTMYKIWEAQNTVPCSLGVDDVRKRASIPRLVSIAPDAPKTIGLLLLPGFSMLSMTSFLSPFETANSLLNHQSFNWLVATHSGAAVQSNLGFATPATHSFCEVKKLLAGKSPIDILAIIAGPQLDSSPDLAIIVRHCRRQKIPLVALNNASWLLAEMGVLQNAKCTIHWEKLAAFTETFDGLVVSDAIYAKDDGIWSCAGEIAAFDLAVRLIEEEVGTHLTEDLCRRSISDRPRRESARQRRSAWLAMGCTSEKLIQAIELMEDNLNDPVDLIDLSTRIGVSRRQLERLFVSHIGSSPYRYYLRLRLDRARELVENTRMALVDVAVACGFVSSSHFSKCFREQFRRSPSDVRRGAFKRADSRPIQLNQLSGQLVAVSGPGARTDDLNEL